MTVLMNVMKAEWMKTRHTALPWMALLGGLFLPLVQGLITVFRWKAFVPDAGYNGWDALLSTAFGLGAGLLFPFLAILLVAFSHNVESKANAWKRLLVIPLGRSALYWGKWLYLVSLLMLAVVSLFLGSVLVGALLGWLKPALVLPLSLLPTGLLFGYWLRFFISLLAILTLQYVLSIVTNNTLIPVLVGVFAYILTMVLVQGWSYAVYDPYAFPMLIDWEEATKRPMFSFLGLYKPEWLSLLYSGVLAFVGLLFFKQAWKR